MDWGPQPSHVKGENTEVENGSSCLATLQSPHQVSAIMTPTNVEDEITLAASIGYKSNQPQIFVTSHEDKNESKLI